MTTRFHILRDGDALTLARHLPVRMDVQASATLPGGRAERLAHQVRQDMWRLCRRVRGFSPVVTLEPLRRSWRITAGGRVAGRVPEGLDTQIGNMLEDRGLRARWVMRAGGVR